MDFSFFITDNKSGHKTKETWFSKNYPEEYKKATLSWKEYKADTLNKQ
jgi:hypothetical protein